MSSPYPLSITVEMLYDGVWNNISADVRQTQDISMKWGRDDEATVAAPNDLGLLLNNGLSKVNPSVSGRYSPRNPRSDLYGKISRNTPIRVRLGAANPALWLPGVDGSYASTPDVSALDITGDIDIRIDLDPANGWDTSGNGVTMLASKFNRDSDEVSWVFYLLSSRRLYFRVSPDGTFGSLVGAISSTTAHTASTGRGAVRVTLDVNNGAAGKTWTYYTAATIAGPWTQVGSPLTSGGTTTIYSGTAPVEVGSAESGNGVFLDTDATAGRFYKFEMRSGIGGTVVANPDFTTIPGVDRSFTDSAGRVWSLNDMAYTDDLSVRMVGEITNLPVEWTTGGHDVWVPLRAKSINRRLGQGATPLRSALYRDLSTASDIVAYWSCEDGRDATTVAEAFGGPSLAVTGDVTMAGYSGFAGADAVPTFGTLAHLRGPVPSYTPATRQRIAFMLHQDENQSTDRNIMYAACNGGVVSMSLVLKSDGSLRLVLRNAQDTNVLDFSGGIGDLREENAIVWVLLEQVGSNINWQFGKVAEGETVGTVQSGTLNNYHYGRFTSIVAGSDGDLSGAAVGHIHIINGGDDDIGFWDTIYTSLVAWSGETAGERIIRLCREQNVPLAFIGSPADTEPMGRQGIKTLLDLIRECAESDMGVLDDHTRMLAKRYRTRESLYRQGVALTLDYALSEPAPPLQPISDDQHIRNDVTVTRDGGSSARSVQETGQLNVQDPATDPLGVGRYDSDVSLSLHSDSQAANQAGWRRHLGTVDEDRYAAIKVNLGRDPHLSVAVEALTPGDRVQIINPPDWLPPETIDQIAQGGKESLSTFKHEVELVCTPAAPWSVIVVSDGTDEERADADGSQTAATFIAGTNTSMSVSVTSGPLWATSGQFPLEIVVAGVVLNVTAISGSSSPQTFTITQAPVNGINKTISAGTDVRLAHPMIIGL